MAENNELQKMYEYQELKGKSGYEYVVRGAEVFCGRGSKPCVLNLPKDHGVYTSDGRPLITVSDTKPGNISGFGICNIDRKHPRTCVPELGSWEAYGNSDMKINGEYAVERNATVTCKKGGIIILNTSGQTSPSYDKTKIKNTAEIVENIKGIWSNNEYNNDFLGHIKPNKAGLYNFGINFYNNNTVNKPGSIFVYETGGGKLKFIGAYEIKDHTGNEQNKFLEDTIIGGRNNQNSTYYWRYWADIALKAGKDYYVEIDCPSREAFYYMLIGNQEKEMLTADNTGGVWILNSEFKTMNPYVYGQLKLSKYYDNGIGNPVVIMYLAPDYNKLIRDFIAVRVAQNTNIVSDTANILSIVSAIFTGVLYIGILSAGTMALVGHVGAALTGIATLLTLIPRPVLERVRDGMYKNPNDCVKVTLYDSSDGEHIDYGNYDITGCKVEVCPEYINGTNMSIYGEKYLIGDFHMLEANAANKLKEEYIKEIFDNIDKEFK